MQDDGLGSLGFFTMAVLYFSCGISCLFVSFWIQKLGFRLAYIIGAILQSLWVFSSILAAIRAEYPEYKSFIVSDAFICIVLIVMAVLAGISISLLFVT